MTYSLPDKNSYFPPVPGIMFYKYFPTEEHENLISIAYGRYDDMRMSWVGRPNFARNFAITDTDQVICPVCEDRVWLLIQNVGANTVWLNFGLAASANNTVRLLTGEALMLDKNAPWRETIHAVCEAGLTSTVTVNDVWQSDTRGGRGA